MPETFEPQDLAPVSADQRAVQNQMAAVIRAVEELTRGFSEAILKWQDAREEADRLRVAADKLSVAFEATADSRNKWKTRALLAAEAVKGADPFEHPTGVDCSDPWCEDIETRAIRLVNYAMNLRMYGEKAPGGNETWTVFDQEAETFLRSVGRRVHTE